MKTIFLFLFLGPIIVSSQNENYPIPPKTDTLLFYIQRNHNANTIIYDANYDSQGLLNSDEPMIVYWRRYDEQGQKMELRTIEKWYAYGLSWEKSESENEFIIKLVADKSKKLWLRQLSRYKSALITIINNKLSELEHIYIFADNSGAWPRVKYLEFYGYDLSTNKKTYEKIMVNK
jgi:hypothetical protein